MRRKLVILGALLALAPATKAQIGKSVAVAAGTPEDQALTKIYSTPDGPEKISLLDQFVEDFGKEPDLALLADQLYVQTYLAQKNYPKVFEYGEKALTLDPDNLSTAVNMAHAAEEQGDPSRLFDWGEKVAAIVARYKSAPAPSGVSPEQWSRQKEENLKGAQNEIGYAEYALLTSAFKVPDPKSRAGLLERFVAAFPDSSYSMNAREELAASYQQAQDYAKMQDVAQKILSQDPQNVAMLLLLADSWSERGQHLDQAAADAQKALDLLAKAQKPGNLTDEQWQQQVSLQKGLAYSSIGQVYVTNGRNAQAVEAFKQANPLLKSNTVSYARNLYRLGFTLAKMQHIPEARAVLTEAVSLNSPYKTLAQETLDKIGGSVGRTPRKKP